MDSVEDPTRSYNLISTALQYYAKSKRASEYNSYITAILLYSDSRAAALSFAVIKKCLVVEGESF